MPWTLITRPVPPLTSIPLEVTLGSVIYRLAEDDCLAMQLDEPTAFRNRTRKPARYLVIVAGERARASRR